MSRAWDKTDAGRAWRRSYYRQRRARARAEGRCYWCKAPAEPGRRLCAKHLELHADQEDARKFARSGG